MGSPVVTGYLLGCVIGLAAGWLLTMVIERLIWRARARRLMAKWNRLAKDAFDQR